MSQPVPSGSSTARRLGRPGRMDALARRVLPPLEELGGPGTVLSPVLLVALLSVSTAALVHPAVAALEAGSVMTGWLWIVAVASPVLAVAKAAVLGAVAWAVLVLCGRDVAFRTALSTLLYGELVLALQGPSLALFTRLRGTLPDDPGLLAGLQGWVPESMPLLEALAGGLSPFHLAWWGFVTAAWVCNAGVGRIEGWAVTSTLWLLLMAPAVLRVMAV